MFMLLTGVQLVDQPGNTLKVGCRIRDHQSIGRCRWANVTVAGNQRPQQPGQVGGDAGAQLENPSGEGSGYAGRLLVGPGFCFGSRNDQQTITIVYRRETLGIENRIKQAAYAFTLQALVRQYGDAPLYPGVENDGLIKNGADFPNHIANICIAHRQLPGGVLSHGRGCHQAQPQAQRQQEARLPGFTRHHRFTTSGVWG
ncbi:hypothetical protein D9M71_437650 [compost metagenome]